MEKKNLQNESGRSMVEMLGVLAIIGVLSVGGIAGYTTAMRSHRANEIVNACSLLYVVANTKNESGDITYESVLGTPPTGVDELKYNNGSITAKITDAAVCTEVKNKLGDKVTGDCSGTSPYSLAVTLGEVKEVEETPTDVAYDAPLNEYGDYDSGVPCIPGTYFDFGPISQCNNNQEWMGAVLCGDGTCPCYGNPTNVCTCVKGMRDNKAHTTLQGLCKDGEVGVY